MSDIVLGCIRDLRDSVIQFKYYANPLTTAMREYFTIYNNVDILIIVKRVRIYFNKSYHVNPSSILYNFVSPMNNFANCPSFDTWLAIYDGNLLVNSSPISNRN